MMGILDELLGGGPRQRDFTDFVNRYEQGQPSEGYSDQEVVQRYSDVAHAVAPDPQDLGQVLTNLHQTPGLLRDLLGGGGPSSAPAASGQAGSILASPLAKAALAGIAAMLVKRVMRGQ